MKYCAINIGPIFKTFSMARKSREFWAASYMFSYLMRCILEEMCGEPTLMVGDKYVKFKAELISPVLGKDKFTEVGLFPDRAFFKIDNDVKASTIWTLIKEKALPLFSVKTGLKQDVVQRFFRVMVSVGSYENYIAAITSLNRQLDLLELNQNEWQPGDYNEILTFLRNTTAETPSLLFQLAFGKDRFSIDSLEKMALAGKAKAEKSFHRYICIVQADGDNMSKTLQALETEDKIKGLSKELIAFGEEVCKEIKKFGGLPIYAGGDDLLFMVPVVGKVSTECFEYEGKNVFDLLEKINGLYKEKIVTYVDEKVCDGKQVTTHMSYGVSITYYKYPLYEAWSIARDALFGKAKHFDNATKNAVAVTLRKHSGSDWEFAMHNSSALAEKFTNLIANTMEEDLVSSVVHKLRENMPILSVFAKDNLEQSKGRFDNFFEKIIDTETKNEQQAAYLTSIKELLIQICENKKMEEDNREETDNRQAAEENKDWLDSAISECYSMGRIAKFIKGEDLKDE